MIRTAAIIAALVTAGCQMQAQPDYGGNLADRYAYVDSADVTPLPPVCASACTIQLAKGCVYPGIRLGFHGPLSNSGIGILPSEFERQSAKMASYYPPMLAEWFMAHGRWSWSFIWLDFDQLSTMGAEVCAGKE